MWVGETFVHMTTPTSSYLQPLLKFKKKTTYNGRIETEIAANTCIGANVNNDFHIPDVISFATLLISTNSEQSLYFYIYV